MQCYLHYAMKVVEIIVIRIQIGLELYLGMWLTLLYTMGKFFMMSSPFSHQGKSVENFV